MTYCFVKILLFLYCFVSYTTFREKKISMNTRASFPGAHAPKHCESGDGPCHNKVTHFYNKLLYILAIYLVIDDILNLLLRIYIDEWLHEIAMFFLYALKKYDET